VHVASARASSSFDRFRRSLEHDPYDGPVKPPFHILAADHGRPLEDMLEGLGVPSGPEARRAFKADLVDTVGADASAVLLDPDVSLPALRDRVRTELLVRIEADDVELAEGLRRTQMVPDLDAEGARSLGADAAKLMVFMRADRADEYPRRLVREVLADCGRAGLPCVVELMTYRLDGEPPETFAARREDLIVDGAVALEECGAEVLKLEYPGSAAACGRLSDAVGVPWAVLSAGVDHEAFRGQLRDSMDGGASGFIAGRSVWKEAVGLPADERRAFLQDTARRRFAELVDIVAAA
jgi:tagatose-1,6-bisphosphate aldolase